MCIALTYIQTYHITHTMHIYNGIPITTYALRTYCYYEYMLYLSLDLERIRKALTSQLHAVRSDLAPKDEKLIHMQV